MKSLVIAALAMMIAVSGCSGKRCCHENTGNSAERAARDFFAEGGAQWSGGQATDDSTVQFSSAATFNKVTGQWEYTPTFTFTIYKGNNAIAAASAMEMAFNRRRDSERCPPASSPDENVRIACHEDHIKNIRYINHTTYSPGDWVTFEKHHMPGGLTIDKIPFK